MTEIKAQSAAGGSTARAASPATEPAPVETRQGKVRGTIKDGINVFKGIPYAASTSGANRFRQPQPPQAWSGVRDATAYPNMAPQPPAPVRSLFASWTDPTTISEDCLGLNIWTPGLRDGGKRPVMVWFHGGDFASLSGSRSVFDGTRLARRGDVVVVTVNHRLNAFGFLYLGQLLPEFREAANPGMLDLVAALEWVRDNIAEFGGDPGNVTIFGQSGGGGKVATMMAMPAGKGLFHRAIIQSGTYARNAHLEAMSADAATGHAQTLLAALELSDAHKLLDLPMEALVAGSVKASQAKAPAVWRPVADGKVLPAGPSWPSAPEVSADIPLMIGSTATEMSMLMGTPRPDLFDLDEAGMRKRLSAWFGPKQLDEVLATFRKKSPGATPGRLYFDISTAAVFRRGAWRHADLKVAQAKAPVYLYEIDWETPIDGGKWGSPHSVEHPFVFDNVALSTSMVGSSTAEPQKLADQISPTWIAFARTGNPNNPAIPEWPAYTVPDRTTMVFDTQSRAEKLFREDERLLTASAAEKDAL
ncbi:carboxylesterase family protein [Bradyrhizobium sp. LHD-71]|uniref:carboxylesterase/lipase family protein n=1 Tax=Bradyrhizobium sp. LHD-71 TaxID=3072141 RepID=UPI00280E08D7|nr:carboxylesterase family protein [Bradyrhizobium sp. LHD-71]MDQ8727871.1 carboxylesterase family protein [Bradyrhizobium sp. LHD-71]